jgi:hypothetical protein
LIFVDLLFFLQIISDSLMLCHAGLLIPLVCLALAEYLKKETHLAPWAAATAHLHILRGASDHEADFKVGHSSVTLFVYLSL